MDSISIARRLVAALTIAALSSGCTKEGATSSDTTASGTSRHPYTQAHTLRFASGENLVSLNPMLNSQGTLFYLAQMTMAWLIRGDVHSSPNVPELVTVVPTQANGGVSADGKTITYHLRHDAKWSDGVPFTADDVVFTTKLIQDPKTRVTSTDGWDDIVSIGEPDKYTVVYHLKKPYASYAATFFSSVGANPAIVPKHLLQGKDINTDPYNALPIGIGPFKYKVWKRGDAVELEANPTYFRGAPKLQSIVFKEIQDRNVILEELRTHEIDLIIPVAPHYINDVRSIPNVDVHVTPSFYYDHMDFNMTHPVVQDVAVRHALRMALDRTLLNKKIRFGMYDLGESLVPPVSLFHENIPFVKFDIAGANKLLDAAGWVRGSDGIRAKNGLRLSLDFATSSGSPDVDTQLVLISGWWKQIGVDVAIKHYLSSLLFAPASEGGIIYGGRFDVVTFAWGGDPIQDLAGTYGCAHFPPNGQNDSRYCDPPVSALMDSTRLQYDLAKRVGTMKTIQEKMVADTPIIVLDTRKDIAAYNDDLKNWNPSSIGPFDDMMKVDI